MGLFSVFQKQEMIQQQISVYFAATKALIESERSAVSEDAAAIIVAFSKKC